MIQRLLVDGETTSRTNCDVYVKEMFDFRAAYEKIRPSIVGIGISVRGEIDIIGTGFFYTAEGHIITNKHVLENLLVDGRDGERRIAPGAAAWVIFPHSDAGKQVMHGMVALRIVSAVVLPNPFDGKDPMAEAPEFRGMKPVIAGFPQEADIAILEARIPKDIDFEIPFLPAEILRVDESFAVGTPVAVLGYPGGLALNTEVNLSRCLQMTPLMQSGIVSGILPFPNVPNPETFVLDMYITPGSSGSPVFDQCGRVVGLVYATRLRLWPLTRLQNGVLETSGTEFVNVPNSLGLALPSSRFPSGVFDHIAACSSREVAN